MKFKEFFNLNEQLNSNTIRLYRGLEHEFDPNHDMTTTDAMNGYSTWTDNPELARQYAGNDGYVYYIDLLDSEMGDNAIDEDPTSETYGDRVLFFFNDKPASINGVKGNEVLVYNDHEFFDEHPLNPILLK